VSGGNLISGECLKDDFDRPCFLWFLNLFICSFVHLSRNLSSPIWCFVPNLPRKSEFDYSKKSQCFSSFGWEVEWYLDAHRWRWL
jgi:hypothetical protein